MHNTLLLRLLRKMTPAELRRWEYFVASPYHNTHVPTHKLASYLLAQAPRFAADRLDKQQIWPRLYPTRPYRETSMNNLISGLLTLTYEFISWERWRDKDSERLDLLATQLADWELPVQVNRILRKWEKILLQEAPRSVDHHYQTYRLQEQIDRQTIQEQRAYSTALQAKNDAFDAYFYLNKLRIACDMTSRSGIVQGGYVVDLLPTLAAHFADHDLPPPFRIYRLTLTMLELPDQAEAAFAQLKADLVEYQACFAHTELRTLYSYLLNYCVKQINAGQRRYYEEILTLYQTLLQEEIIFQHGRITEWAFTNIITSAVRLREYDWAEQFLHDYQHRLPDRSRHNVSNYNLTAVKFERGQFDAALDQLHTVEFTDAFYHMAAKIIQLKIYYLQGSYVALHSLAEASRLFLLRNKQLADTQRRANKRFIQYLLRLVHLQEKADYMDGQKVTEETENLRTKLRTEEGITNRQWLLDQLAAFAE